MLCHGQNDDGTPNEAKMVKKFRRAAAGIDEQLPSDLRPPSSLRRTCDYLFDELVGNAESLGNVHHFVWDRTRAIRNDFSIQQITKSADVEIAIECYERIARFHILSLHQFAVPEKPYDKYDWFQEREQLDRTLLSLMQYYEDHRDKVELRNEAEFRAYCIIFQIQDPIPDLEDRVGSFVNDVRASHRVKTALDLYASACNIRDAQGPLKPRQTHPIAREDWNSFFTIVESNKVSYLMACVAEIYFNMIRKQLLSSIWKSFRRAGTTTNVPDFTVTFLTELLRFDELDQTANFCEHYGFAFKQMTDESDEYIDLNSVQGKIFPEAIQGLAPQLFSQSIVERKRMGRSLSACIRGYNYKTAQELGLVMAEETDVVDEEMQMTDDETSLFVPNANRPSNIIASDVIGNSTIPKAESPFKFGAPTTTTDNPFNPPPVSQSPPPASTTPAGSPFAESSLLDSKFAPKTNNSASPFMSSWGKPSAPGNSTWGAPSTAFKMPSTNPTFSSSSSIFSQPSTVIQKPNDQSSASPFSQSTLSGSIHAPPLFAWPQASSTSAGQPLSTATQASAPQGPTPPLISTSLFAKPSTSSNTEPEKPKFTFGLPSTSESKAVTSSNNASSLFTNNSAIDRKTDQPSSPFNFAKTSTSPSLFAQSESPEPEEAVAKKVNLFMQPPTSTSSQSSTSILFKSQETSVAAKPFEFKMPAQPIVQQPPQIHTDVPSDKHLPNKNNPSKSPTSSFAQQNQPKKPSPLSHSFSAAEQQESINQDVTKAQSMQSFTPKAIPPFASMSSQDANTAPLFTKPTSAINTVKPTMTATEIFTRLANEVINDPERGFLRQFVEHHARTAILSVYEQLYAEELRAEADSFRKEKVARRYSRLWRENVRKLRLARIGREKRERRRMNRKDQSAADCARNKKAEIDAVDDFLSRQSTRVNQDKHTENNRSMMSSIAHSERRMSIDSTSPAIMNDGEIPPLNISKARGSTSNRLDGRGKIVKPTTPIAQDPNRTSHFLGFSVPQQRSIYGESTARKTSRSAYFRLKALGIDPKSSINSISSATDMGPPNTSITGPTNMSIMGARKRHRDDNDSDIGSKSPPQKRVRTPPHPSNTLRARSNSNLTQSSVLDLSPGRSTVLSTGVGEDDDLLARAKAVRQALRISSRTSAYTSPIPPIHDGASYATNQYMNNRSSIQRPRISSQSRQVERPFDHTTTLTSDVPAYRLRESRFVPRESYVKAIEKAQAIISQRQSSDEGLHLSTIQFVNIPNDDTVPSLNISNDNTVTSSKVLNASSNIDKRIENVNGQSEISPPQSAQDGLVPLSTEQINSNVTQLSEHHQTEDTLIDDKRVPEETVLSKFLGSAARSALRTDSSVPSLPSRESSSMTEIVKDQDQETDMHVAAEEPLKDQPTNLDPLLFEPTVAFTMPADVVIPSMPSTGSNIDPMQSNVIIPSIPSTNIESSKPLPKPKHHQHIISTNPFAALAGQDDEADQEDDDASDVTKGSLDSNVPEDEDQETGHVQSDNDMFRQIDDDHFIPNGIIQDYDLHPSDNHNLSLNQHMNQNDTTPSVYPSIPMNNHDEINHNNILNHVDQNTINGFSSHSMSTFQDLSNYHHLLPHDHNGQQGQSFETGLDDGMQYDNSEESEGSNHDEKGTVEEYDDDDEDDDEEGYDYDDDEEGEYDDDDDQDGLTADQLVESGIVKGGTGQSVEEAFELSD